MLTFANLLSLVGLLGLGLPLAHAEENIVEIKVGLESDFPRILTNDEGWIQNWTSVSFTPVKGKKQTWNRMSKRVEAVGNVSESRDGSDAIKDGGAFTILMEHGTEHKCHLERRNHITGNHEVTIRDDVSYLSTCGGSKVRVVCGETEPGTGGDEKSTCTPW